MAIARFDAVSKHYRLGLTRTSLPTLFSTWAQRAFGGTQRNAPDASFWALRDVSFGLEPGESLALVGPNGAGKTTILKLLANITKPTSGRVTVNGRLSALIELGAGFHPDLTGRDNAFLNGAILGIGRRELARRFDEIVAFSGLERFIDTPVKRYSSGMVVRLGFAVAACVEPDILLVDEVLAVGDAAFGQKCLERIRSLLQRGTSIVFVSHNLYLVKAVCERGLYLRGGRVQLAASTADVIHAYERDLHRDRASRLAGRGGEGRACGDLEVTAVEVIAPGDVPNPDSLSSREPAEVRIKYHAYVDYGRVQVSVFVRRVDGLVCCMLRSSTDGIRLTARRGAGVVSIRLERLQLTSGTYFVEAYFLDENDSLVLTPGGGQSRWFTVTGQALHYEDDHGVFEPVSRWSHETLAPEDELLEVEPTKDVIGPPAAAVGQVDRRGESLT